MPMTPGSGSAPGPASSSFIRRWSTKGPDIGTVIAQGLAERLKREGYSSISRSGRRGGLGPYGQPKNATFAARVEAAVDPTVADEHSVDA